MTPTAPKASGRPCFARFVSFVFLLLACFALPQQTQAQTTPVKVDIQFDGGEAQEGSDVVLRVDLKAPLLEPRTLNIAYINGPAGLRSATPATDLGSARPTTVTIPAGTMRVNIPVPTVQDDFAEGDEIFKAVLSVPTPLPSNPLNTLNITDDRGKSKIYDDDSAAIQISSQTRAENEAFRFRITTNGGRSEEAIPMTWTVANRTASVADDLNLSSTSGSITLPVPVGNASSEVFLDIPINNDDLEESTETFSVSLVARGAQPPKVVYDSRARATGTITDDDTTPTFSLPRASRVVTEGGSFTYTVNLSARINENVSITWTVTSGSAAVEKDLRAPYTGTVIFPANDTTGRRFTIDTVDDTAPEGNETFTVTIRPTDDLPDGVFIDPDNNRAVATILDNDDPAAPPPVNVVTIDDASVAESDGNAAFTVSLTRAVTRDVVLAVAYADGTATLADDLGTRPTTVTINEGDTEATLEVPVTNDNIVEGNEDFTVTISEGTTPLPSGVTIGTNNEATGTITEDDAAEVTLGQDTATAAENGTFTYTVSLSDAADEAVTVRWTATDGTATVADDLDEQTGTVTFNANTNTDQTFTIAVNDDDLDEDNEDFTVTLAADTEGGNPLPTGVTIGTDNSSTATITDNDDNYTVSIDNASVAENGARSVATFTAKLSQAVGSDVVLAVAVAADTVTLANDLGAPLPDTVTIDEGKTEATFTVHIINDNLVEENETFTVTLSEGTTPLPDGVAIRDGTATGTIEDDDRATVSITPAALTAAENGTFTYTVSLSAAAEEAVTVRWTATNGTATVADDLQATTNTVTFAANDNTAQTFTIAVNDDDLDEDNETFTVTLAADTEGGNPLPTGVSIGTSNSATGTITDNDDDTPAVNATVSIDHASVAENGGNAAFTVRLTRAVTSDVVLAVAYADGTATLADDLGTRPDMVTIEDGATRATLLVPVTNDNIVEGNENFTVTISEGATPLPEGVTIGTNNTATGTITDDDTPAVNATVSITAASVAENGGNAEFTVSLSRPVGSDVVLAVAYADGTATLADDLEEDLPDTVTIEDGASIATFSATLLVPIINDNLVEGSEDFTVTISEGATPLPEGVTIGTDDTATGTITDDDAAEVTLSPAELTAAEDASFAYTVSLSTTVAEAVTVRWTATAESGDTATVADDLQKQTGTVTFNANDNTDQTFTIAVTDDEEFEQDETFTVTLSAPGALPDRVTIPAATSKSVATIIDNDGAGMAQEAEVSIADADPVKEDAGPVRFTVSLSQTVPSDVVLDITYAAGTAGLEDLGRSRPGTVTIPANATTASFAVPITDDTAIEEAETFTVTLSAKAGTNLPPGVGITDGSAIGTIAFTPEPSVLIEPRRTGAGTALRRHVGRFDRMTGAVVRNRLDDRQTRHLSGSQDLGDGALAMGGGLGDTNWGVWLDGAWAGLGGRSSGRQADIYGGVDYRGSDGDWLIGALIGHELADLDIGPATYEAGYTHFGLYGGRRLSARLLFDGALTYGVATPEVAQGSVSASYDAHRVTARGALTGDFGLEYGLEDGVVKFQPQLGLLYAREQLGAFTDSVGGVADREQLELGRVSAGPRATWAFDGGQLVDGGQLAGGARGQWDFRRVGDGIDERVSAAIDVGVTLDLAPGVSLGLQGDVDGLGITDEFRSFGGKINLGIRF